MAENPANGYLMTGPSISPENWFKTADGQETLYAHLLGEVYGNK